MKKTFKLKLTALILCAIMLIPMTFACGKSGDTGSTTAAAADTTPAPTTPAPTTVPPTTPTPTTTAAPTTMPPIDPNLPYWDQIKTELAYYGLKDGVQILPGADEAAVMASFTTSNDTKAELDVSADKVPFKSAYRVTVSQDQANFWEAAFNCSLTPDVPVKQGDLVVGVLWIKGRRTADSAADAATPFAMGDPPQFYLALKTPTDNWGSEGEMTPAGIVEATDKWQKIWFCGRILNEETQSSTVSFNIFLGYGIQEMDIGGAIAYVYPSNDDTEKAVINLPY